MIAIANATPDILGVVASTGLFLAVYIAALIWEQNR